MKSGSHRKLKIDEEGLWKKKLVLQYLDLFEFLSPAIQEQLMLERDPHGNVQVAKIERENAHSNDGKTGLISLVGNLAAPVSEWTVGGTALTSLMDVERRHDVQLESLEIDLSEGERDGEET
ncbi:hypothetical protein MLD38_040863 [Melastoma candidum]|nr:hypothetical protein MLD38_040863 [Melastoma candidum]